MTRSMPLFLLSLLVLSISTGCSAKKAVEAFAVLDPGTPPSEPTSTPGEIPPSIELKINGSNSVPVESFEVDTQAFYYHFADKSAATLDYWIESTISACPTDPVRTASIVDFADGTERLVQALDIGKFDKPISDTVRIKIVISGLSSCMGYGTSFRLDTVR